MALQKHCYFFELPAELRTAIYQFFFTSFEGRLEAWPPLLKVNKQIYNEALPVHYAYTKSHFSIEAIDRTFQIYAKLSPCYKSSIKHLYCDDPCWRFNAKGAAAMIRRTQKRAEEVFGTVPADFIQVVMRAPGEVDSTYSTIYTNDPVALASEKGWQQIDWDSEFQDLGVLRSTTPWLGCWV